MLVTTPTATANLLPVENTSSGDNKMYVWRMDAFRYVGLKRKQYYRFFIGGISSVVIIAATLAGTHLLSDLAKGVKRPTMDINGYSDSVWTALGLFTIWPGVSLLVYHWEKRLFRYVCFAIILLGVVFCFLSFYVS